jgi:hypothetical protein
MRNSVIAGNMHADSPDCFGSIDSEGYNIVGVSQGCTLTSATGDLLNIDARLFPFMAPLGFHALQPDSPAIDAGDPNGCRDGSGNLLFIDQRGTARPLDGDENGNSRCDIGAYEFDAAAPIIIRQSFLPMLKRNYCPSFFDDFSNPSSGWPIGEDNYVRAEYLNGEYRILSKNGNYIYLFRSPACSHYDYVVEADVHWDRIGDSYGLLFGITGNFSQYYLFYVSADYREYALFRRDPGRFVLLQPFTPYWTIQPAYTANHLKVTRNGSAITLEVNGSVLGTWYDGTITGSTYAGIYSSPYINRPVSDARFDNFSMANPIGSSLSVQQPDADPTGETLFMPVERADLPAGLDRLPSREDWQRAEK